MHRSRWWILALLGAAELLGMSLWFTASAVAPHFRDAWALSPAQSGWLTTVVQLGFVAGTAAAAVFNLADMLPSRVYFATAALLAAAANAALVVAPSFAAALALRFLTGLLLAGVYPPAMKMIATWFQSARGLAIGTIVGALTMGKALPYLLSSFGSFDYSDVILASSIAAAAGGILVALAYRDGPFPFPRRAFSWNLVPTVIRDVNTRRAIAGYLGHMWELYSGWFTLASYFAFVLSHHGMAVAAGSTVAVAPSAAATASLIAFACISAGAGGSVVAGAWADKWGRENVAIAAMATSAACALVLGWITYAPVVFVVVIALVWGFSIVADSAQFSAIVTEVAPAHAVGTALTIQTSLGFALTAISMPLTMKVATRFGWGPAFTMLAVGPLLGIIAMRRLKDVRRGDAN